MNTSSTRPELTIWQYVYRRNGVSAGARGSLRNMLHRSFGARSFASFWRYWNPIFGYLLGRYVFAPLKAAMPPVLALVATFLVCGAVHDLVATVVRGSVVVLFTPWFFFMSIGAVLGNAVRMDLSGLPWLVRAATNLAYVAICFAGAAAIRGAFGIEA